MTLHASTAHPTLERWVIAAAASDLQPLQQHLQAQPGQMIAWRLSHGLAELVPVTDLRQAIQRALVAGAPSVHVRCLVPEAQASAALQGAFTNREVRRIEARLQTPAHATAHLAHELSQPDNAAKLRWLVTGRPTTRPSALPDAAPSFASERDAAFAEWADDYLQGQDTDLLDEIFCPVDEDETYEDETDADDDSASASADQPDPRALQDGDWRSMGLPLVAEGVPLDIALGGAFMPLAADSADDDPYAMPVRRTWAFKIGNRPKTGDVVRLLAPNTVYPCDVRNGFQLQIRLNSQRWKDGVATMLVLYPAGLRKPLRITLPEAKPQGNTLHINLPNTPADEALVSALCAGTVELFFKRQHPAPTPSAG